MRDNFRQVDERRVKWIARWNGRFLLAGVALLLIVAALSRENAAERAFGIAIVLVLAVLSWLNVRWGKP